MNVGFIRPTPVLRTHGDISDYHMVLAPDILRDEEYRSYYIERISKGDTVILDNGIAEAVSLTVDQLDEAIDILHPTYVVLQDIIFGGKASLDRSFRHLAHVKETFPNQKVMAVPHYDEKEAQAANQVRMFLEGLKAFIDSPDIDALGISKYATKPFGSRASIIRMMNNQKGKFHSHKPIHLLGLSHQDGAMEPILYNSFCLEIMGIDSAHYILYAATNRDCTGWNGIEKRPKEFMSWECEQSTTEVINSKLGGFQEIVNDVN